MILVLVPLLLIGMAVAAYFTGRDLTFASARFSVEHSISSEGVTQQLQVLTGVTLLLAAIAIVISWEGLRRRPARDFKLALAFLQYYTCTVVFAGLLGTHPGFERSYIYPPIIFLAIFLTASKVNRHYVVRMFQGAVFLLLVGSLLTASYSPTLVLEKLDYDLIPGVDFRMWGLFSHANILGSLSSLLMITLWTWPLRSKLRQLSVYILTLIMLILAQSKTAYIATTVAYFVIRFYKSKARRSVTARSRRPRLLTQLMLIVIALTLLIGFFWAFASEDLKSQAVTLTGRLEIWSVAITTWLENPIFGYGPSAWDEEFRQHIQIDHAVTAHNQFLQSLSASGIVGLFATIIYLIVIWRNAKQIAHITRGASLAFALTLIIRCISETPLTLSVGSIFSGELIAQLFILGFLLAKNERSSAVASRNRLNVGQTGSGHGGLRTEGQT